mgnify:CR=1 FL=1
MCVSGDDCRLTPLALDLRGGRVSLRGDESFLRAGMCGSLGGMSDIAGEVKPMNADFLGGPPGVFETVGREQLAVLLEHGLSFESTVLDIGCGCLRGGRWIIPLLEPGHYCGIEPQMDMVRKGLERFLEPGMAELKRPRFEHNDRFDASSFGVKFTHFLARSVWTHASKRQIGAMLDTVRAHGTEDCVFLTSMRPARALRNEDYTGDAWVGRSHESEEGGMVRHSMAWVKKAASERGLRAALIARRAVNGQPWCLIRRV